jgi:hypothetical protein
MQLQGMSIQNEMASIDILDGRVLEVFKDRRKNHGAVRSGAKAQRRKLPMDVAPFVGTGRVWVARGWIAVDTDQASRWPKGYEMILHPLEFDDWFIVSLRASESITATLGLGKMARAFHFRALLMPSKTQLDRLRAVHLLIDDNQEAWEADVDLSFE